MVSSLSPISSTALAPVSGYEPWVMRSTSSVKEAIADGNPVLMRVHCAADYPMEDELLNQRLDMESHSILLIGYSDVDEVFYVVDPWNQNWGGEFHGTWRLILKRALSSPANNAQEFRNLEAIGNSVMEKERESISIPHLSKSRQI